MSLYNKHRPKDFNEVAGQNAALSVLVQKLQHGTFPKVTLLVGPSGSGKTTLAGIVAEKLGCVGGNLTKINCASDRGIDLPRQIDDSMRLSPMGGKCRVWVLDEVVQLPKQTQQAFLEVLENPARLAYFILCSNDITGLLPTFMSRCFCVTLEPLSSRHIEEIVNKVLKKEDRFVSDTVLKAVVTHANGSGRVALQLLEAALTTKNEEGQLQAVGSAALKDQEKGEFLAKTLFRGATWKEVAAIIEKVEEKELEGLRRQVLAYATVMLCKVPGAKGVAGYTMIRCFQDPWHTCGKAGLAAAAWEFQKTARL